MEWWHWLLAGAVLVGGASLLIWRWVSTKSDPPPSDDELDLREQWYLRRVEEDEDLLRSYQASALDYTAQIERLKARIDAMKRRLEKSYAEEGLSAEEIAERFRKLRGDPP